MSDRNPSGEANVNRVLITGSNGFIGRHLCHKLTTAGAQILTFDVQDGDISEYHDFGSGIDHVFHLAAQTFVPESWRATPAFYRVNTLGTVNVLEYCRKKQVGLTYVDTYVYGNPDRLPIDEQSPVRPNTPYNHSKYLGEEVCKFYAEAFDVKVTILRLFNVYGYGQSEIFLIPSVVKQVLDAKMENVIVGDLKPKRDYVYIDDVIDALVLTGKNARPCSVYNVGSGYSTSVADVVACVMSAANIWKRVVVEAHGRKNEVMDIVADTRKIRTELGWAPKFSFQEGIGEIVKRTRRVSEQTQ